MKIKLNNKECNFNQGETLIQIADRNGIHIPRFCYHDKLSIAANCRMCLVEQSGVGKPQPACSTPAQENQEYFTKSFLVTGIRFSKYSWFKLLSNNNISLSDN